MRVDQRKNEAERIRERYPDRIPVICEKSETSKLPDIDKTKYIFARII
jgi:GABA(A) receptor-associated protein